MTLLIPNSDGDLEDKDLECRGDSLVSRSLQNSLLESARASGP